MLIMPPSLESMSLSWKDSRIYTRDSASDCTLPILSLLISDLLAIGFSISVVLLFASRIPDIARTLLICSIGYCIGLLLFGVYPGRGMFGPERIRLRAIMSLLAFAAPGAALSLWTGNAIFVILVCISDGMVLFLSGAFFETVMISCLNRMNLWRSEAVIVGDSAACNRVKVDLELFPELGLRPVEFSDFGQGETTALLHAAADGRSTNLSEYLVDVSSPLPAYYSIARPPANLLGPAAGSLPFLLKRGLDIVGALAIMVFASPVLIIAPLFILAFDGGPVFFSQKRGGKNGRELWVWKFRSMYKDAPERLEEVLAADPAAREEWNRFFKLSRDPRILPVIGNFMRKSSIDELPQLWNVLNGDMSLVGPRPFPEDHLAVFSNEFRALRHRMQPGITGLWQVTLRSDGDVRMQERLDSAYVRGWSFWLDLYILFRTPIVLMSSRGAR